MTVSGLERLLEDRFVFFFVLGGGGGEPFVFGLDAKISSISEAGMVVVCVCVRVTGMCDRQRHTWGPSSAYAVPPAVRPSKPRQSRVQCYLSLPTSCGLTIHRTRIRLQPPHSCLRTPLSIQHPYSILTWMWQRSRCPPTLGVK